MCLRASDDNDAVIWVKNALDNIDAIFDFNRLIRDSSRAQFLLALKCFCRKGSVFSSSTIFLFPDSYGRNFFFIMSAC